MNAALEKDNERVSQLQQDNEALRREVSEMKEQLAAANKAKEDAETTSKDVMMSIDRLKA